MAVRLPAAATRRSRFLGVLVLIAALVTSLLSAPHAAASGTNTLTQLGLGFHNDFGNDLSQIGLALYDGSYLAGDGSVRTITGDGSVRFISVGPAATAALCFHDVAETGTIRDGTSNTILFSETVGLQFTGGSLLAPTTVRSILDGTSNTIIFPETPLSAFCIGDVGGLDPVAGPNIADGTSNTIVFGESSKFDLCLSQAVLPAITDGTSNTILLGESRNNVCFDGIVPSADLVVTSTVPEPTTLALIISALLGLVPIGRNRVGHWIHAGLNGAYIRGPSGKRDVKR